MSLIVCKFGGTSVASPERIQMVAKKLIAKKQAGHQVVAVVSAMGKTTDELVGLAASLNDNPPAREMDRLLSTGEQVSMTLLAMAIEARGYKAMSFTGRQAGIETDGTHAKAKIVKVHNERIMEALNRGVIAVVAGFQGIDANGDITTLGRGGSDTTAVAVAHGLDADVCEIYSDVDGVYTADPRVCPRAKKLDVISYDDMLELSSSGAGVLQMRAVEFARKYQVVIHSRSAFSDAEGTYIKEETDMMEEAVITGIAHDTSEVKFTIRGVPDMTGVAAKVFSALAGNAVSGHDHPDHLGSRHHRYQLHVPRRRSGARERDDRAHPARHQRPRLRRGRGHREGEPRGHGHEVVSRRGGARVLDAGREPDQHPGHLHVAHPPVGRGGRRASCGGGALPAQGVRPRLRQRVRGNPAQRGGNRCKDEQGKIEALPCMCFAGDTHVRMCASQRM